MKKTYKDKLKALVLFERSGCVSIPLVENGVYTVTIDLQPSLHKDNLLHKHYIYDIRNIYDLNLDLSSFDLLIAFPPCTYFSKAGLHWLNKQPGRKDLQQRDLDLVKFLWDLPIKFKCFENPGGSALNKLFKPCSCKIDYCEYDIQFKKPTCLWLDNLPPLLPDFCNYKKYGSFITNMSYSSGNRDITPIAVGYAMCNQWLDIIKRG